MTRAYSFVACVAAIICLFGCQQRTVSCMVTQYGGRYMTYHGSSGQFDKACRDVLRALSYKEETDGNGVRYPYYGEGASSHKDGDRRIAVETYMTTKDETGAQYRITTLTLGERDPVVTLESTSSERYRLVNALAAELHRRGIPIVHY